MVHIFGVTILLNFVLHNNYVLYYQIVSENTKIFGNIQYFYKPSVFDMQGQTT